MIEITNGIVNIEKKNFEFVERKGLGHPDTLCDAIAEKASVLYSKYVYNEFNMYANHWFDKVMLIGGESKIDFGIGELVRPYKVIFAGKAVKRVGNKDLPLDDILYQAASFVLTNNLTDFNSQNDLVVVNEIVDFHGAGRLNNRYQPASKKDLKNSLSKKVSNDCNILSAFAPETRLENTVRELELYLNSSDFKCKHMFTGWDIKIVGTRRGDIYNFLINIPFIGSRVKDIDQYFYFKDLVFEEINQWISDRIEIYKIILNPQDKTGHYYLTSRGSAADTGDVGVVGRGNRINGLITPMRPMSIEASCGKNPLDHTGKIYNYLSKKWAEEIYAFLSIPVQIHVFTMKEEPLEKPTLINVQVEKDFVSKEEEDKISKIVSRDLLNIDLVKDVFINEEPIMW